MYCNLFLPILHRTRHYNITAGIYLLLSVDRPSDFSKETLRRYSHFLMMNLVLEELEDILLDMSSFIGDRSSILCDGSRFPISIITISITWPTSVGGLANALRRSIHCRSTLDFQYTTCHTDMFILSSDIQTGT